MRILLFDLDGVLLEPFAYHQALCETVMLVGRALGYPEVKLTQADIEVFESVNVTSEWDTSAICAALLLRRLWTISPDTRLPQAPPLHQQPMHRLAAPDFRAFFQSEDMAPLPGTPPIMLAEQSLLSDKTVYSTAQVAALRAILRGARKPQGSLTHLLFQELVLGSKAFRDTYEMQSFLRSPGYLLNLDRPNLSENARVSLLDWLRHPGNHAGVFTNRPSQPSEGFVGAPEAELGLAMAKLEILPLVGRSGLEWLAEQRGLAPDALLKPSAAHALAALRRAAGDTLEDALRAAAELVLDQKGDPGWEKLDEVEVYVFEDSAEGLHSLHSAQECLARFGVKVHNTLMGVAQGIHKRRSLEAEGAQVFSNLSEALQRSGAFA